MESHPYSYGTKLTGLILHLFFTVVLTIAVFLLASMLSKNIFELSDVGTEQFLDSGYYTKCIEKKCDDLSDYLRLLIKGESRTSEENRRTGGDFIVQYILNDTLGILCPMLSHITFCVLIFKEFLIRECYLRAIIVCFTDQIF